MKITEIYKKYKIPPQLQIHQLRVAAVAKHICDNLSIPVDTNEVVSADLLHDMGNIIKFDLTLFPQFLEPEGLEYWQTVKKTFMEEYGSDEHIATKKIAEEITDVIRVHDILRQIGASRLDFVNSSDEIEFKIANYADDRVSINGVITYVELIKERKMRNSKITDEYFKQLISKIGINEKNIQKVCKINLDEIDDKTISGIIEELKEYEIN